MGINFEEEKKKILTDVDSSRKGSIDENIKDFVSCLNQRNEYCTTSSCSGRIVIYSFVEEIQTVHKKGCKWLLVSHTPVSSEQILDVLKNHEGSAVFKFEPFILHVRCFELSDAQKLHAIGIASGFRNSGITISSAGRITLAIRSTHSLEVPLSESGYLLVSAEYIEYIVKKANAKMAENQSRIHRLCIGFQTAVNKPTHLHIKNKEHEECEHQSRSKHKEKKHMTASSDTEEYPTSLFDDS